MLFGLMCNFLLLDGGGRGVLKAHPTPGPHPTPTPPVTKLSRREKGRQQCICSIHRESLSRQLTLYPHVKALHSL